jgi:hypothetical protein
VQPFSRVPQYSLTSSPPSPESDRTLGMIMMPTSVEVTETLTSDK